ncbi:MAG: M20/M25/M40 family metallo-hydrolase [Flavobacterium sp.]|nr:MAG: M20/M25/M40 family metallo-hydrolase [Flavobacterium sp.]
MMPRWITTDDEPLAEFSTKRAMVHVTEIAKTPHYVGSAAHAEVADYLVSELKKLGLDTKIEEGTTLTDWGNLVKSKNILARIKGSQNSKALLLLSHYDSAPHSYSHGASDDASGVAAVLESLRAFLHSATPHKNDIIVLFSDGEELGLNGAAQFVTQSGWAKDVGLALNCEARGTSGPSYMLMEVNKGNAKMVDGFSEANPHYPVANSLMYSIYKMLPNDTDLTVFREQGKIPGFNFAFIDSHFNYHTAQDDADHLDLRSLQHQGSYLMPLMKYFGNTDLTNLDTDSDSVYFSTPFNFMSYSFSWIFPMLIIATLLFVLLVFIGLGKRALVPSEIGRGFLNLLGAMAVSGLLGFFGWKIILSVYPEYNDILQGFTYNGHSYIFAFVFLALSVCFLFYFRKHNENVTASHTVAPLTLWLIINIIIAIYLPGAAFFIIPVICSLLMFGWYVVTQKSNPVFNLLFSVPALILFVPFIWMFPIGLGLKILFGSTLLTVLVFSLLLPVFGSFQNKAVWSGITFLASVGLFIYAHLNSGYSAGQAKPNSLVYLYDADKDKAWWATYDVNLDEWTKLYLGEHPGSGDALNADRLFSKYNSPFTYSSTAPAKDLAEPTIDFLRDSVGGTQRYLKIKITPNRKVNRYDIFANERLAFYNLKANGAKAIGQKGSAFIRNGRKLFSYYIVGNEPLEMEFSIDKTAIFDMSYMEASFDLMQNPAFDMKKRTSAMMPTPFVLTDAVIIRQKIRPSLVKSTPIVLPATPMVVTPPAAITDTIQAADDGN